MTPNDLFNGLLDCPHPPLPTHRSAPPIQMDIERNLGEQPIAQIMRELELTPAKLVQASTMQLNHKMVSRATKGRRLTGNVMKKLRQALNAASGKCFAMNELFNYTPLDGQPGATD